MIYKENTRNQQIQNLNHEKIEYESVIEEVKNRMRTDQELVLRYQEYVRKINKKIREIRGY